MLSDFMGGFEVDGKEKDLAGCMLGQLFVAMIVLFECKCCIQMIC
jgi:hypothetical protein